MSNNRELSVQHGVNDTSSLLHLEYFNIFTQCPFDIMHIILEGVIPHTIQCTLLRLVKDKDISPQRLFTIIHNFPYKDHFKSNQPVGILTKSLTDKFGQNSYQSYTLSFVVALVLGNLFDDDHPVYSVYLYMMDVITLLYSPVITSTVIPILKH